jgi:UDP-N-acetylglucosamine diphosphorylase/glucosamine-1-phosphate N-acetyltransferase
MSIMLFEDEGFRNLQPLVYARPLFELRCGAWTLRERVEAFLLQQGSAEQVAGICRPHLMQMYGPSQGLAPFLGRSEPILLINARARSLAWLPDLLEAPIGTVYVLGNQLLAARLSPTLASLVISYLRRQDTEMALIELRRFARIEEREASLMEYPWHLINSNGAQIVEDVDLIQTVGGCVPFEQLSAEYPNVVVHRPDQVFVRPGSRLDGPLVLDARDGPIIVDGTHIEPFSFIQGPTYLGRGSLIASARIRGETSIGPVCRIGGEVEASVIQGFSNKHHDGFLGHSYLGEWVNIGAMTTNSDLKNTYGTIRVSLEGYGQVDSGELKLGCFLADHVKLGIGVHISGGSVIGIGSNIFGVHSAPKTVPPFTWGGENFHEYRINGMIDVARKVMGRRKQEMSPAYEQLLRDVFAMTRANRRAMPGITLSRTDRVPVVSSN